ncbi:hypothetical protein [Thermocrinis sp.]
MKKVLVFILILFFLLPATSIAKQGTQRQVIKKEKVYKAKKSKKAENKKVAKSKKAKNKKLAKKKRVRISHNINKPEKGEILKIEAMVKDLNEQ